MAGLCPRPCTWMPGTRPGMTFRWCSPLHSGLTYKDIFICQIRFYEALPGDWQTHRRMLVREPEGMMSRSRVADDFETIRSRMEELRQQRRPERPAPASGAGVVGHRGPCACAMSLFPDEADG